MSSDLTPTRLGLQQVAVHVLARRRFAVTGRFGLRPTPGGVGTPAFGDDDLEVVRTSGRFLVLERGAQVTVEPITTLAAAAELVGVDLAGDFSVGTDTPAQAPADEPLAVDDVDARTIAAWWTFGQTVIDDVLARAAGRPSGTTAQLWPEHFDVGAAVERGDETLNIGSSPGDAFESAPYLYLGPWSPERPGDAGYWNAPFGAVLRNSDLGDLAPAPRLARAVAFFADGLARY